MEKIFPDNIYKILKSHLDNRYFIFKYTQKYTTSCPIKPDVPHCHCFTYSILLRSPLWQMIWLLPSPMPTYKNPETAYCRIWKLTRTKYNITWKNGEWNWINPSNLERRLTWRKHIFSKSLQLDLKLDHENKIETIEHNSLMYKIILKPIWAYGFQLWRSTSNSNIQILERFQSQVLRMITNLPMINNN